MTSRTRDPAVVGVARRLVPGMAPSVGDPRALGAPIPGPGRGGHARAARRARARHAAGPGRRCRARRAGRWLDRDVRARRRAARGVARGPRGDRGAGRRAPDRSAGRGRAGGVARAGAGAPRRAGAPARRRRPRAGAAPGARPGARASSTPWRRISGSARTCGRPLAGSAIAPRTVAYRLERIERLLGGRLDADRRLRLATTLFARRVLGDAGPAPRPVTTSPGGGCPTSMSAVR